MIDKVTESVALDGLLVTRAKNCSRLGFLLTYQKQNWDKVFVRVNAGHGFKMFHMLHAKERNHSIYFINN